MLLASNIFKPRALVLSLSPPNTCDTLEMWRPKTFGSPISEDLVDADGRIILKGKLRLVLNHA